MRGIAIAALWMIGCGPNPPVVEKATPVDPAPPVDAAIAVVEPPPVTPDAAVEEAPPEKLSPLELLPPSGEQPMGAFPAQDAIDERYALAVQHAREPLGLALLLDIANSSGGVGTLDHTRWDDTWATQWDQPAFWMIVTMEPPARPDGEGPPEVDMLDPAAGKLTCPNGTKLKGKWQVEKTGVGEVWCQRGNGTKHGPYKYYEEGYDMSEGVARSHGDFVDGKKHGLWYWSESFSGWSLGAYRKGVQHGLWEEGNRDGYTYSAYVDGKLHGLVTSKSSEGDDVTIGEHRYDRGVLHGAFRVWGSSEPYALETEGSYDHGKKTGEWRRYDDSRVRAIEHWDADVAHGDFVYLDEHGNELARCTMDHGSGDWIERDTRGVVSEGKLVGGVKQGKWGERDPFGSTWETGTYADGKRTGPWVQFDSFAGAKTAGGDYVAGLRHGDWIFLENGVVRATGSFAKGKPTGRWELIDQNGTQTLDLKNGKLIKFDGKKPTKQEREAFASWSPDNPEPIYILGPGQMY